MNDLSDSELETKFGPQWRQIVALLDRISVLTPSEVSQIAAAWGAAVGAAWGAAGGAAWDTAWDTARDAARDAAWGAAALSVYDLIGSHGFTREHYDVLAGPLESVIGPLHTLNAMTTGGPDV
jgi:hypothetical protein